MIINEGFYVMTIVILIIALWICIKWLIGMGAKLNELNSKKISQSVKYGKAAEHFMPFMAEFKYPTDSFRFLGTPIDGIAFTEESLVFIEFKTASSKLSSKQELVKSLVEQGKVSFEEIRI